MFQFPLHRDPRCNFSPSPFFVFLLAFQFPLHRDPRCNDESSNVPASTSGEFQFPLHRDPRCNFLPAHRARRVFVSVPFTSGSSLQQIMFPMWAYDEWRFSSLYIGILAATYSVCTSAPNFLAALVKRGFEVWVVKPPARNRWPGYAYSVGHRLVSLTSDE